MGLGPLLALKLKKPPGKPGSPARADPDPRKVKVQREQRPFTMPSRTPATDLPTVCRPTLLQRLIRALLVCQIPIDLAAGGSR